MDERPLGRHACHRRVVAHLRQRFGVEGSGAGLQCERTLPGGGARLRHGQEPAGLVLTPGGVVTVFMMPLVGRLTGKVQPRYLIAVGAAICAYAMYDMTKVN